MERGKKNAILILTHNVLCTVASEVVPRNLNKIHGEAYAHVKPHM
jgi:hypothetical protein